MQPPASGGSCGGNGNARLDPAACGDDDWEAAGALIAHVAPDVRLAAVQALACLAAAAAAAAAPPPTTAARPAPPRAAQGRVDTAFLALCSAASDDCVPLIRLEALRAVAGMHRASEWVKLAALNRRAVSRAPLAPATAAGQAGSGGGFGADARLLDAATGAMVHGAEDDAPQVRLAAVAAVRSLGSGDSAVVSSQAASLLVTLVADDMAGVRLAALEGLLGWAEGHRRLARPRLAEHEGPEGLRWQDEEDDQQELEQLEQQGEQEQPRGGDAQDGSSGGGGGSEHAQRGPQLEEGELEPEEGEVVEEQRPGTGGGGGGGGSGAAAATTAAPAPRQGGASRRAKKRKPDLPAWAPEGIEAALAALHDSHPRVRSLALRLLEQLPPARAPKLLAVLDAVTACCSRFPDAGHLPEAAAVLRAAAEQRAMILAHTWPKLAKALAAAAAELQPECEQQQQQEHAQQQQQQRQRQRRDPSVALQLASVLALAVVAEAPRTLSSLLMHLDREGSGQAAALQPLLLRLQELQQQQHR